MTKAEFQRSADPYRDTDVIDERAPRVNQSVVGLTALAGVVFGWPLAWALMGAQLLIGLLFGRRWCLPCLFFFEVVQPRIGEGPLEDARAPRLANQIGVIFLAAASITWWAGAETLGLVLGAIVAALALLAASTGFCAGCELYRLQAKLRGISPRHHDRVDPADFASLNGNARTVVQFTHPLCTECHELSDELAAGADPVIEVNVRERPELAHKYGIAIVPTAFAIDPDGVVLDRVA